MAWANDFTYATNRIAKVFQLGVNFVSTNVQNQQQALGVGNLRGCIKSIPILRLKNRIWLLNYNSLNLNFPITRFRSWINFLMSDNN